MQTAAAEPSNSPHNLLVIDELQQKNGEMSEGFRVPQGQKGHTGGVIQSNLLQLKPTQT